MMRAREILDSASTRDVATLARVDPRSVDRVLEGKPTRPSVRLRVIAALAECGLESLASPNEPSASSSEPLQAAPGERETP
ncbi:hypothetical protein Adeh_1885 [Anaeromyxobacter dehalogenans 2CP-C]|uniref:Uncharacterized protein n=1 Tax=Anaeromyxobacter dehalogenans (strain 2CP-C) TaxID=290397 RepID=Q2IJ23_ANADE|nr:hypothetical protein Adeh_1885 [Anaeromyxobacter dehalogenans 2CP-C]